MWHINRQEHKVIFKNDQLTSAHSEFEKQIGPKIDFSICIQKGNVNFTKINK